MARRRRSLVTSPAFGVYMLDPHADVARIFGLFVVTLEGDRVSAITRFDNSVIAQFGLPRSLPGLR